MTDTPSGNHREPPIWPATGVGVALGAGAGVALGVAIAGGAGVALGVAIGAGVGLVIGAAADALRRRRR